MQARNGLLALALLCAPWAYAQETRGEIIGRVEDATGAVIAGAKVRGVNIETSVVSGTTTNGSGDYVLPFLVPGTYTVTIEAQGFKRFEEHSINVVVDDKTTINARLQVGAASDSVSVTADSELIDASDASMSLTIEAKSIQELPLKDGNPLMLAALSPGVMNLATGGMTRPFDNGNTSSMAVNGTRSGTNEYKIDGAPNTGGTSGNVAYIPPPGVVSEVKVQTNPFDASTGFSTGAAMNVSLKSGTNQIHGQVYSFLQNPALNANAFFSNKAGLPKDNYRQVRWGANANGPVFLPHLYHGRNRTFWMYGYEGIRDSLPRPQDGGTYTMPTAAQRAGDFSDLLAVGSRYQIYDPMSTVPASGGHYSRTLFPNNIIPASRIHSTATTILNRYYPLGNVPGTTDGTNNYIMSLVEKNQFQSHLFRVDHSINDKNRFFVRGTYNNRHQDLEHRFNDGAGLSYYRNNRGAGIDDVHIFSSTFLLNTRYNYTRYTQRNVPLTIGLDITSLGFSQTFADQINAHDPRGMMLPDIAISGYPELNAQSLSASTNDIHAMAGTFTKIKGSHTITFGGEYRIYRDTNSDMGRSAGNLAFGTNYTKGPLDNSSSSPLGQGMASFLLGTPTGGYYNVNDSYAQSYSVMGFFAQDSWKVSSRLTVNYGLRWEYEIPTTERYNRAIRGFDFNTPNPIAPQAEAAYAAILSNPANANNSGVQTLNQYRPAGSFHVTGGLTYVGVNGLPRQEWEANSHNFEPRVSIAYSLNSKTVIRSGYGIFYDIARQSVDQTGFNATTNLIASNDNGQTYLASLENPFPNGFQKPTGSSLGLTTYLGQNVNPKYTRLLDPYVQRWQFSIQRRLGGKTLLEIAYVGNRGTHLRVTRNNVDSLPAQYYSHSLYRDNATNSMLTATVPNPYYGIEPSTVSLGSSTTTSVQQLLRPYSQFTGGATTTNEGYSWFHSLQTRIEKRFSGGFFLTGAWTWSKFMEATGFLNNTDLVPAKTISDQDRTHRFVVSSIYELPFGPHKRWGGGMHGILGQLAGGWQLNGIYQVQSGGPLGFGDVPFYGDFNNIALPRSQRTVSQWFNINAGFDRNSADSYVYHWRFFPLRMSGLRSMGLNWWDLSASKNNRITERVSMQLRVEFINAFNHPHFGSPNTDPTSSAFGTITSTNQQPRNIQIGLKVMF